MTTRSTRSYSFKEIHVEETDEDTLRWRQDKTLRWLADCGNDHALGKTAGEAVAKLVDYMIEKRENERSRK